jgi:hypothetical protein
MPDNGFSYRAGFTDERLNVTQRCIIVVDAVWPAQYRQPGVALERWGQRFPVTDVDYVVGHFTGSQEVGEKRRIIINVVLKNEDSHDEILLEPRCATTHLTFASKAAAELRYAS